MLILRTLPAAFGLPSASMPCMKAMALLTLSGLPWRAELADPRAQPRGKLPVLVDGETVVPDSEAIRDHLARRAGPFRAGGELAARVADEHLYFAVARDRWMRDAAWEVTRAAFFPGAPEAVTDGLRAATAAMLAAQGLGRLPEAEVEARVARDLAAIDAALGDAPFLAGEAPGAADASVAAAALALAALPAASPLTALLDDRPRLTAYAARARATLWPDADAAAA